MAHRFARAAWRLSGLLLAAAWLNPGRAAAGDGAPPTAAAAPKPVLMAQVGHSKGVNSVAFSPDGAFVLTGSKDKTARLWETATGRVVRRFEGHTAGVTSVAFSPDGAFVLTGSYDKGARVWETATGREVERFEGHDGPVWSVAFSPDGAHVVTGSADTTARIWDRATRKFQVLKGHAADVSAVAVSPDGTRVLTGSWDKSARLWASATGAEEAGRFDGHASKVTSVAFVAGGAYVLTGSEDKTARLWVTATRKEFQRYTGNDVVTSVAPSPDGRYVATGSWDRNARLWEAVRGTLVQTFAGHAETVNSVAFSRDGKRVLTGSADTTTRLWDAATGKEVRLDGREGRFEGRTDGITSVAFSPDGTRILTGSDDRTARLWEGVSGKAARRFEGHADEVNAVAFSPDGAHVLAGGGHDAIANGAFTSGGDTTARLWETATGTQVRLFSGHTWTLMAVAYSPDGAYALTGSFDKTARLWDVATGKEVRRFEAPQMGAVNSVAFSPDGAFVLTGTGDKTARLWETATGRLVGGFEGHALGVTSIAFSPDGAYVLTASRDQSARMWETSTRRLVRSFYGHTGWVTSVAFSPDGRRVVTSSGDQNGFGDDTVRFWDATTGKEVGRLEGSARGVRAVAFAKDGTRVLTGSADGTTRLWDVATGRQLCSLVSFRDGTWAVTDPDGRFDASNGGDVDGLHWVVGLEVISLAQLKDRYYEPGLLAKILGFNKEPLRAVAAFEDPKLYPDVEAELKDGKLNIRLADRGGGIGRVVVMVNGKEHSGDVRGAAPEPGAKELTLPPVDLSDDAHLLPGQENRIEVFAYNAEGYLRSRGRAITSKPEGRREDTSLWAVIAGVSRYEGKDLTLRFAAKDAADFAKALTLASTEMFGADRTHVTLLADARREALLHAFEAARQAKSGDILVVFLAGHGINRDEVFYYLTADAASADLSDADRRATSAISSAELVEEIKRIPALKQVLILDTCASGTIVAALGGRRGVPSSQVRALDRVKDRTGMFVLAGCAADAVSYESAQYGQGLLTYSLLLAMRGEMLREGEYVDVASLFNFARDRVPVLAGDIGGVQQPNVSSPHGGGSFDIGRLTPDKQREVPLEAVRARFVRPNLVDATESADVLELGERTVARLRDGSYAKGASYYFVDAATAPGGYQIAGSYSTKDGTTKVRFRLLRDKKFETPWLEVEGASDELPPRIVDEARKHLPTVGR